MKMRRLFRTLGQDTRGATIVEFALVAPVLMLMLMGLFDFGHQQYAASVLHGQLQASARAATLETGSSQLTAIDERLTKDFKTVVPTANITVTRRSFQNFSDVRKPEAFTDTNGNGQCDDDEPFEDLNGNASWDADRGRDGLGSARDAVLYTATATYSRLFPLAGLVAAIPKDVTVQASTVLRNQPFRDQSVREPVVEYCA